MASTLSPEQRRKIELKKQAALERKRKFQSGCMNTQHPQWRPQYRSATGLQAGAGFPDELDRSEKASAFPELALAPLPPQGRLQQPTTQRVRPAFIQLDPDLIEQRRDASSPAPKTCHNGKVDPPSDVPVARDSGGTNPWQVKHNDKLQTPNYYGQTEGSRPARLPTERPSFQPQQTESLARFPSPQRHRGTESTSPSNKSHAPLSPILRAQIERNKQLALERRAKRQLPDTKPSFIQDRQTLEIPGNQGVDERSRPHFGPTPNCLGRIGQESQANEPGGRHQSHGSPLENVKCHSRHQDFVRNERHFEQPRPGGSALSAAPHTSYTDIEHTTPRSVQGQQEQLVGTHQHLQQLHKEQRRQGPPIAVCFRLVDQATFSASFPYNELIVTACKQAHGKYNHRTREWVFNVDSHQTVIKAFNDVPGVNVRLSVLPPLVIRVLRRIREVEDDSGRVGSMPANISEALYAFQRTGVMFALSKGGRVLIGDEMGLGKTLQATAVLACYMDELPALILAPSSLKYMWRDHLLEWLPDLAGNIEVVSSTKGTRLDADVCIVPYDYVPKLAPQLKACDFKIVIGDEAHYLKNEKAKRTQEALPLFKSAKRALLLTGTPALSRPKELFTLLQALLPRELKAFKDFAIRYCSGGRFGWDGASNLDELNALLTGIMIRRKKKEVMKQLPPKQRRRVFLSVDEASAQELAALRDRIAEAEARAEVEALQDESKMGAAFMETKLFTNEFYRETARLKIKPCQEYIATLLDGGCKFLLFAHHKCLLDGMQHLLEHRHVDFIRIDGSTAPAERPRLTKRFQESASCRVALLSIKVAGQGLTLTAASDVVFAEMSWTPGDLLQAEDRVHRIGQENSVTITYLHCKDSVDDFIWSAIQNKLGKIGQALDGRRDARIETETGTTPIRKATRVESSQGGGTQTRIDSFLARTT